MEWMRRLAGCFLSVGSRWDATLRCGWGSSLGCDMKWMRWRSLGCDVGMRMVAGPRCWNASDGDHWDPISDEREGLPVSLLGAGSCCQGATSGLCTSPISIRITGTRFRMNGRAFRPLCWVVGCRSLGRDIGMQMEGHDREVTRSLGRDCDCTKGPAGHSVRCR
jgi:hypothetical protein